VLFDCSVIVSLVFSIWRKMTGQRRLAYCNLEKMIDAHCLVRFKLREMECNATANFTPALSSLVTVLAAAMYIVYWTWRLYGDGRAMHAGDDAALHNGADLDPAQLERVVRLALACSHPSKPERNSIDSRLFTLIIFTRFKKTNLS